MEMLVANISTLGSNPLAWGIAALAAAKTLLSAVLIFRCPIHRGLIEVTEEMSSKARSATFHAPASFLFLVLIGMGLATGGLYMLADTQYGGLAIVAAVVGVFLFMTEPSRLTVINARNAVYASSSEGGEALALARDSMKGAYISRMFIELTITLAVFAALYFF